MSFTATLFSFDSTRHFEGPRGGRLSSRRHAPPGRTGQNQAATPYTTPVDASGARSASQYSWDLASNSPFRACRATRLSSAPPLLAASGSHRPRSTLPPQRGAAMEHPYPQPGPHGRPPALRACSVRVGKERSPVYPRPFALPAYLPAGMQAQRHQVGDDKHRQQKE
jgi:hypothetical protein